MGAADQPPSSPPDDLFAGLNGQLDRQVFSRNRLVQLLLDPASGAILEANAAACAFYGYSHDELVSRRITDLNTATEAEIRQMMARAANEEQTHFEVRHRLANGEVRDVEVHSGPVNLDGRVCLYSIIHDITPHKRSERLQAALFRIADTTGRVRDIEELYAALHAIIGGLMDARNFYIALHDPGSDEISFPYFVDETEPPPPPQPFGQGLTEYVLTTGQPLLADPARFGELVAAGAVELVGGPSVDWLGVPLETGDQVFGVLAVQSYSENIRFTRADLDLLTFVSRHIANAIERTRAEAQIRRLAFHDSLTGLPNQLLFNDRLEVALAHAHRARASLAVVFLDLDRFKVINDSMGHRMGDKLLKAVSDRIAACLREGDTVARLGGDEFVILLGLVDHPLGAAKAAGRLLDAVRAPFVIDGYDLFASASIGVSVYPSDGLDAETLVRNADTAMYRAKEQGRDHFQLFAPAMNASAQRRLTLENGLRRALAQDELALYYQPVVEVTSGRVVGVEALLRWETPTGFVAPNEFLPIAELTGLVVPLAPWVLRTACRQMAAWHRQGFTGLSVAVNLSARQLQHPSLVETVTAALAEAGLPASSLELEITETNAMQNAEATAELLRQLSTIGVRISIDDFGVGYSSLSYLKRLPVDTLKIDQSFVRDSPGDRDDAAIAAAVVEMAHALNLQVVAEGVENEQQRDFLRARGCDRMQGFLISRALPADEMTEWLAAAR